MIDEIKEIKICLEIAAQRDKYLSENDGLIIQEQKKIKEVLRDLLHYLSAEDITPGDYLELLSLRLYEKIKEVKKNNG